MITVFLRTILLYIILIASMRLMGKRQVGELELSELIVTIMLSDFASTPIYETDIPLLFAIIPILLLLSTEVILSFIILKLPKLKILLGGKPSIIIRKGIIDEKELFRQRMCLSELISNLRQQGFAHIEDIDYAILEENGKLSVFEKASARPPSASELGLSISDSGISHPLIIDRVPVSHNLSALGWSQKRLREYLNKENKEISDVLLFTVDDCGKTSVIYKEEK